MLILFRKQKILFMMMMIIIIIIKFNLDRAMKA